MKKSLVLGALLLLAFPGWACDQCGCGLLLGVQPYDHANNFGLQWRMRYLHGDITAPSTMSLLKHGGHDGPNSGPASYTEEYMVLEARGQVWIGDRFNLTGSIPLLNNFQAVDGIRRADLYAVGDPMLLARYVVLGSKSGPDTTRLRHRLTAGLGVKIPLGRTDVEQFGETLDHDLQPGTGTWDGLASLEYSVRGKRFGGSVALVGRYNTEMTDAHRMGNSGSLTAEVFRVFRQRSFQWLPSVGGYVEYARPDADQGMQDMTTGGTTVFSNLGVRLWWKALGFSFAWQHALVNDIGSLMIPNRERFVAGINYSFEKD
ncbi:MAG: hypothetical protein IPN44_01555 [Flavobacteriales bacterium]|nr:hypothetical protein [Flavobacteriales bacterium]